VITHPAFATEPWAVRERGLHLDVLAQSESIFALSNGHVGMRGNLDEGEPHGIPGTYLNSVYERRPMPYGEPGYGYPEYGQTLINVTNGKLIRLLVDDEPFDVRYGTLLAHERVLDLRAGTLVRQAHWASPSGAPVTVRSTRLVSLTQRAVAAIYYEVEPVEAPVKLVVQSELVANEALPVPGGDPRAAAALESALLAEENTVSETGAVMVHRTRASRIRVAAGMQHEVRTPGRMRQFTDGSGDVARLTVAAALRPGQRLRLVKYVAYGWSTQRSRPALRDQVMAALAAAGLTGWRGLVAEQRAFLDEFWSGADVALVGDAEVQQAVRYGLFEVLQAGARGEQRPIPAKGLTGPGYDGHTFWDTEMFVLPVLTHTRPAAAADVLRWRLATLPAAVERAAQLGLRGAMFPWRTINGRECSGYWPAGTAALHVTADVAYATTRYVQATADHAFERDTAVPLLVATARLWHYVGHYDTDGKFRIDGVTGPDEYSALADNNIYTNLMAQRNLIAAAEAATRHPEQALRLGVGEDEVAAWRDAAAAVAVPYDARLGVHQQSEGFTDHATWDFSRTGADQYPLMLHFPYFELYRRQVVKQADLVLAMHLCPEAFTDDQKARNFAYYETLTVRDSSLSAGTQAVLAAEVGHLDLAHDYLAEAALVDLDDLENNTRDGMHLASLAGAWIALVAGLGGMRVHDGQLCFRPQLPQSLGRLMFRLRFRGRRIQVEIQPAQTSYRLLEGALLTVRHDHTDVRVSGAPVTRDNLVPRGGAAPAPPPGRAPARWRPTPTR
jgi:alpha,alpha-trehalose phosphorylase